MSSFSASCDVPDWWARHAGPGGGYRLARSTAAIAIADIVAAVDEPSHATRCEDGSAGCIEGVADTGPMGCQTHDLWDELGRQIQLFLEGVTLADVVAGRVLGRAVPLDAVRSLAAE